MFWLIEVLVWLLILVSVSEALIFVNFNHRKNFNTYQIFMPDVDGLINGSPVRLMGIQIGYVNQLTVVGDDIYLRFVITDKNVKLPEGTIATVEFSGLGGSKSLELYPPEYTKNLSGKMVIAEKPKRIHDSLGLLNEMYDQVMGCAYTASRFMDKLGFIKSKDMLPQKDSVKEFDNFLDISNDWLDNMQKQSDNFSKKMKTKAGKDHGSNAGKN